MQTLLELSKKTTLVVDGNWLLISRFSVMKPQFSDNLPEAVLRQSTQKLTEMMLQSLSTTLRLFRGLITNVILVADNKSWRHDIPKPSCITDIDYKGNRSSESGIAWDYIWPALDGFLSLASSIGITTCRQYGIEGDDWCWWWSRKLNAQGINVITWTSDNDIKQLIQKDPDTGAWTGWWEKSKGLFLNEKCKNNTESENIFDSFMLPITVTDASISKFAKTVNITYYNPAEIVNEKIFIGDAGDNILPVFTYMKNGKTYKMTLKELTTLIDIDARDYSTTEWQKTLNNIYKKLLLLKQGKLKGSTGITTESEFVEHTEYNRGMVWLNESTIPQYIQEQMSQIEYKELSQQMMYDLMMNWKSLVSSSDNETAAALLDELFG